MRHTRTCRLGFGWTKAPLTLREVEIEVDRRLRALLRDLRLTDKQLSHIGNDYRAGRLPGFQENDMSTKFRFALGAAVVLSTSLAAATEAAAERDSDVHRDAERAAANARDEIYRASGRTDLIERRGDMPTDGDEYGGARLRLVGTLQAYRQPIEAGEVIGRAEYRNTGPSYFVRYRAGDGRQVDAWFDDEAITLDPRVSVKGQASDEDMPGLDRD